MPKDQALGMTGARQLLRRCGSMVRCVRCRASARQARVGKVDPVIVPYVRSIALCLIVGLVPVVAAGEQTYPGAEWEQSNPADVGLNADLLHQARDYALSGGGSGMITRHGRLVVLWGDVAERYDLKSTSKSIGGIALGLALKDGRVTLDDAAVDYHPDFGLPPESNRDSGWIEQVTLRHLATQTAGFEKPGGYGRILFQPGTMWLYSDAGPNWLAECLTLVYRQDMRDLLFSRVFTPIGITDDDLRWRRNQYRDHEIQGIVRREFGSGVSANVDAMARIGLLYLREGRWGETQILSSEYVHECGTTDKRVVGLPEHDADAGHGNASDHYGLLWWNNADGKIAGLPRDAFWSWGLYDSLIVVIPSLDIVASRAGRSWERSPGAAHYDVLEPFLKPIAQSVVDTKSAAETTRGGRRILGIDWAPRETIRRAAQGSDNWPLTWGDDDALYTAYGDGRGFEPFVDHKLSLGLARITGGPENFQGVNLRAPTAEQTGDGARGMKASGMLMVDGTLYMLVRNADHAQLAWSEDRGRNWTWADWKFTVSFGCPTFLNFGTNYAGARDEFVYVYSFDSDTAYDAADRLVLARVPAASITDRSAYEFFAGVGESSAARWTREVRDRGGILERPGLCYRCGVTYDAPIGRYLLAMLPGGDTRHAGGLAVFEAPEPWGPWTAVFATDAWDVGPGESASFPTKWISADGRTVHMVFSGDDAFSVRRGTLTLSNEHDDR